MIVVKCTLRTEEETPTSYAGEEVFVESHWNSPALVRITVRDKVIIVNARDLYAAVRNAAHTAKY